jgi:sugar phosphate permease
MWNIAHNLGGFAAPLIAGGFAKTMGWKWGMWAPGIIGLVVGSIVLIGCKDKPEDLGFPPVEPAAPKPTEKKAEANKVKNIHPLILPSPWPDSCLISLP